MRGADGQRRDEGERSERGGGRRGGVSTGRVCVRSSDCCLEKMKGGLRAGLIGIQEQSSSTRVAEGTTARAGGVTDEERRGTTMHRKRGEETGEESSQF